MMESGRGMTGAGVWVRLVLGLPSLILVASISAASDNVEKAPTLKEAIREGLDYDPVLKMNRAAYLAAQETTKVKEAKLFPTINAQASGRAVKDPIFNFGGAQGVFGGDFRDQEYDASLRLSQPLYQGGALLNAISAAKVEEERLRQKLFAENQAAAKRVIVAYYTMAEEEAGYQIAVEHAKLLRDHAAVISRHEGIGRARRIDRLQSTVNLSLAEAELLAKESSRFVAADHFRAALGRAQSGAAFQGDFGLSLPKVAPIKLEQALAAALANNPLYREKILARDKRDYDQSIELQEDRPSVTLDGSWGYRAFDRATWWDESSRYYQVGVTLTVPLFSGLSFFPKRRAHAQKLAEANSAIEEQVLTLRQALQAALADLEMGAKRVEVAFRAVKEGREALNLANASYRQGVANHQDVLNAQTTRNNSEKVHLAAQYAYLRAVLELRHLMGVDLEKTYAQ